MTMENLRQYRTWLSESELNEKYFPTKEELEVINNRCKYIKDVKAKNLSDGLVEPDGRFFAKTNITYVVDVSALTEYVKVMDDLEIEIVPDYFTTPQMSFLFRSFPNKVDAGKYETDSWDSEIDKYKNKKTREFVIRYHAENADQFEKIVNSALDEIIGDIKKVRVVIQIRRKDLPDSLKAVVKNKALERYRESVDNLFYNGQKPEIEDIGIGEIIAEIYSEDKTIIDTISDIENEDLLDSILKSLDKMKESVTAKTIRAYLRSSRILKEM